MLIDNNLLLVKLAPAIVTTIILGIFPIKEAKKKTCQRTWLRPQITFIIREGMTGISLPNKTAVKAFLLKEAS